MDDAREGLRTTLTPAPAIEGFELLDRIGAGPRSVVWRARTHGGADVTMKVFHAELSGRPGFASRFEKETAALTAVSHPNVLGALERGRSGPRYFIVSEWMREGSLRAGLRTQPSSPALSVEIGLE